MAYIASLGRGYVCRAFADGDSTVMAVLAHVCSLSVIEGHDHRSPNISGMANLALFTGDGVSGGFIRSGTDAIMTPRTVTRLPRHCAVVKQNLQPIGGVVAHIAGLRSGYVRGTFTGGDSAVMTVFTQVSGLGMVDRYYVRLPSGAGSMTSLALIRC